MSLVTAHSSKKNSAKKGGKKRARRISHMHIKPARNGFTAETHYAPEDGLGYSEPDSHVFDDARGLADHVSSTFGAPPEPASEPDGDEADEKY